MKYIEKQKGKIASTDKGCKLISRITAMVADPVTTAKWELALAGIETENRQTGEKVTTPSIDGHLLKFKFIKVNGECWYSES